MTERVWHIPPASIASGDLPAPPDDGTRYYLTRHGDGSCTVRIVSPPADLDAAIIAELESVMAGQIQRLDARTDKGKK